MAYSREADRDPTLRVGWEPPELGIRLVWIVFSSEMCLPDVKLGQLDR